MSSYAVLVFGFLCAVLGGEFFVRGAVGLARWAGISPGIIGATVAAFATSGPELSVAISAAASGDPALSFGNVLGGNVLNISLILGLTLLLGGICTSHRDILIDYPVAIAVPILTGLLLLDGTLSRTDGAVLLLIFAIWFVRVVYQAKQQRSAAGAVLGERRSWRAVGYSVAGLILLFTAGRFITSSAESIALELGVSDFIIGAVVVAIGTSMPELVTSVISRLRGYSDIGLGTVIGSNLFNGLCIVGLLAILSPFAIAASDVALPLMFGAVAVIVSFPTRRGCIGRWRGGLLLALYVMFVLTTLE